MTLEIKTDRRNLTFGSGEPAVPHEKAVEIVKEILRAEQIAEMVKVACTPCDYDNNGSCDLLVTPGQCSRARCIAEAFYEAGYRKQFEGEWETRKGERWIGSEVCEKYEYYACSRCGKRHDRSRDPYCPNCGANMKGGKSE